MSEQKFKYGLTLATLLRHALDEHAPQPDICSVCEVIQDLIAEGSGGASKEGVER